MPLKRQWFRPGRRVEQIGKFAAKPLVVRRAPEAAAGAPRQRALLSSLAENVGALFSIALSLVLIAAIAALVFAFVKEIRREAIYLDPIDVPEDLVKRGFTPAVVTDRLLDQVRVIQNAASTTKPRQGLDTNAAQVDIQVPGGAVSMKALVRYARSMLDLPEQHLGGEITRDGDMLNLLLRLRDRHSVTVIAGNVSANSVDGLMQRGGEAIVQATDPYVLASYWFDREQPSGKFDRTLAAIQYVLAHPPTSDDAWALNLWGLVLQTQGNTAEAIVKYRLAIATDPAGSPAYANLFNVLIESGQRDEAAKLLDRAAAQSRPAPAVLDGMGNGYALLGRYDVAIKTYQRALALDPANAPAYAGIAGTYYQMRRYDDAERAVADAITRAPSVDAYLIALGLAIERGRIDDARAQAEQIKAITPIPALAAVANGFVRLMEHRYPEAAAQFEQAIADGANVNPYVWWGFGHALAGQSKFEAALEKYERALKTDPRMVEALTDRGAVLAALGRDDAALQSFAEAEKSQPRYARLYDKWAAALSKMGRADEAAEKRARADALAKEERVVFFARDTGAASTP